MSDEELARAKEELFRQRDQEREIAEKAWEFYCTLLTASVPAIEMAFSAAELFIQERNKRRERLGL